MILKVKIILKKWMNLMSILRALMQNRSREGVESSSLKKEKNEKTVKKG